MSSRSTQRWIFAGLGTVYQVEDHAVEAYAGKSLFRFTCLGQRHAELFPSIEHALIGLVAAKYSGSRGVDASGEDTAAGWFMQMIGADQLVPAENPAQALTEAVFAAEGFPPVPFATLADRMVVHLARRGYTIARENRA